MGNSRLPYAQYDATLPPFLVSFLPLRRVFYLQLTCVRERSVGMCLHVASGMSKSFQGCESRADISSLASSPAFSLSSMFRWPDTHTRRGENYSANSYGKRQNQNQPQFPSLSASSLLVKFQHSDPRLFLLASAFNSLYNGC